MWIERKTLKNYEGKIIIVGEGGVGKTSLIRRLVDTQFNSSLPLTQGINITKWEIKEGNKHFSLDLWDFGGQEIYHSTHQFFLSKRAIYIYVWNARTDDDLNTFNYWLNLISLFGEDSPILVVQSKIDERQKEINKRAIKEKFPSINSFYKVSSKSNIGIDKLKESIIDLVSQLDFTNVEIPDKWRKIKNELKELSHQKNFLSLKNYFEICQNENVEEKNAYYLSSYLSDLGVILHFQNHAILKNIIFTNPNWVTNSIYKLIDSHFIIENRGKFNIKDLNDIWDEYDKSLHIQLIELGKVFEIFFQLNSNQDYLIPALLPVSAPEYKWENDNEIIFKYSYEFMPKGILDRFIVRYNELIYNNIFWRKGVIITSLKSTSIIQEYTYENIIEIRVQGENKRKLLSLIQEGFESIHNTLNQPKVTKLIPCICSECVSNKNPYYFDYESLLKGKEKKIKSFQCANSFDDVNVFHLLEGVLEKEIISISSIEQLPSVSTESISYDWNESDNLRLEIHIRNSDNYLFQKVKSSLSHHVSFNLNSDELFIIEWEEAKALLVNSIEENKIKISVTGYRKDSLLSILRYEIEKNSRDIYAFNEVIKCNCIDCKKSQPFYFDYAFILKRIKKDKTRVTCHKSADDIDISNLLNQHYDEKEKEEIRHVKFIYSTKKSKESFSVIVLDRVKKIKMLISKNQTKTALETLTSIFEKHNNIQGLNACILHSSNLNELKMRKNLNLIDFNQEGLEKSKINNSILELIQMEFKI